MVAGVVGEDGVLELVGADRCRVFPGTEVETLLPFGTDLQEQSVV